jgi:hypothetical protein
MHNKIRLTCNGRGGLKRSGTSTCIAYSTFKAFESGMCSSHSESKKPLSTYSLFDTQGISQEVMPIQLMYGRADRMPSSLQSTVVCVIFFEAKILVLSVSSFLWGQSHPWLSMTAEISIASTSTPTWRKCQRGHQRGASLPLAAAAGIIWLSWFTLLLRPIEISKTSMKGTLPWRALEKYGWPSVFS